VAGVGVREYGITSGSNIGRIDNFSVTTPNCLSTPTFTPTDTPTAIPTPTPVVDIFTVSKNMFHPAQGPVSIHVEYGYYPGRYGLRIYNSAGEHIRTLADTALQSPAYFDYTWDGKNKYGDDCASGIYILDLIEPTSHKQKLILLIR
jgi:hypothetical protein